MSRRGWEWGAFALALLAAAAGARWWAYSRAPVVLPIAETLPLAREALRQGRLGEVELLLIPHARFRNHDPEARLLYEQVLLLEGRLHEFRQLLRGDVARLPDPRPALLQLARIDLEAYPLERMQATLDAHVASAPGDPGVVLAQANHALRAGRLDAAARGIARYGDLPGHMPLARARAALDLARARNDRAGALLVLRGFSAEAFDPAELLDLQAWAAAQRGDAAAERGALEALIAVDPGHGPALERLVSLAAATGDTPAAERFRQRKAQLDADREAFRLALERPDAPGAAARLAELASRLGRRDEAAGWSRVAGKPAPTSPSAPAPASPPASSLFAALLADLERTPEGVAREKSRPSAVPAIPPFVDDATAAGLVFTYHSGKSLLHHLPETMGGGVGLLDFDNDGWLDVHLVQGGTFPPADPPAPTGDRLFRNRRDGTFEDASDSSGISRLARGYGQGIAVGDVENDGDPDLFLTRFGAYQLLLNQGDGTFTDATAAAGLDGPRDWPTSAAFADLDSDGDLDLYVAHYLEWDPQHPRPCRHPETSAYTYCAPLVLPARADHLFRNDQGRFVDVTSEAGIVDTDGRGLGVVACDLDDDGRVDLYVANDATANFLFRNTGKLRFEELGAPAGVAGNAAGGYQGSMGIACGDTNGDGRPDLAVTNLYGECTTLYRNLGGLLFADQTDAAGLTRPTRFQLGFGLAFLDANNDGHLDLAQANGHVNDYRPAYPYAMPAQLLLGGEGGRFVDRSADSGTAWTTPRVGRGLTVGDLDNDGDADAVLVPLDAPVALLRNPSRGTHWLTLSLEGRGSNRDAVGARVTLTGGGRPQTAWRIGGGSYQSAGDSRLHFGLGAADRVEALEIRWPSGATTRHAVPAIDAGYLVREGQAALEPLAGYSTQRP